MPLVELIVLTPRCVVRTKTACAAVFSYGPCRQLRSTTRVLISFTHSSNVCASFDTLFKVVPRDAVDSRRAYYVMHIVFTKSGIMWPMFSSTLSHWHRVL